MMNNLLKNKTVLVAGAGGLLGSKIVTEALAQGAKVIAADLDIDKVKINLKRLNPELSYGNLEFKKLDITSEIEVKEFFSKQLTIDGAVNATYPRNAEYGAKFFDVSLDSFNENLALHLGGAFLFMQKCASYFLMNKNSFSLVNISSVYGVVAPKFNIYHGTSMTMPVEYAAIKSAIIHLSKYVSSYVSDSRFRVNCVSPGGIIDSQPESFLNAYKSNTHGKGMLKVDYIVGSVIFLLSNASMYSTGQNIIVDDGFSL